MANKYHIYYGYSNPNWRSIHIINHNITNTFDEAKRFISSLNPELIYSSEIANYKALHTEPELGKLYAKIRAEGRDFWITEKPFKGCYFGRGQIFSTLQMSTWTLDRIIYKECVF